MKKTWDERYCDDNVECILTEFLICCSVASARGSSSNLMVDILYLNGGGHRRDSYIIHYQCIHYNFLLKYQFFDAMRIEAKKQPNIIHLIVDSSLFHLLQTTKLLYEERRCRNDGDGRVVAVGRIKL